ncbi:MAG: MptD family putative ECF transporter S component [Tissierellia bacterium]|nr:MptD family putative ECF transporter S component [Tissierellia bacterium]
MNKSNLSLKDLVNIGIFTIIYFVFVAIVGAPFGIFVVSFLFYPFFAALLSAIIILYFMAKVQKKWSVFILCWFPSILMTFMGHTIIMLIHGLLIAILAEFIHRKYGFDDIKGNILTHSIIGLWTVGGFWQIFIVSEQYGKLITETMGESYANQLISLPWWILIFLYLSSFIGGLIGGNIASKILRRHFSTEGDKLRN